MYISGTNSNYQSRYTIISQLHLCLIDAIRSASSSETHDLPPKHDPLIALAISMHDKSILPVVQDKCLAVKHASSLSLTLQIQSVRKILFSYLISLSKNFSLLTDCTATTLAWPTTLSFKHITIVFLLVSPHLHLPRPIQT